MPGKAITPTAETAEEPVRGHQPGPADFREILSEDIEWEPFAAFSPAARLAIVVGEPDREGPYNQGQTTSRYDDDAAQSS